MIHELKCVNPFFQKLKEQKKTFELRKNDRNYKIGDTIILMEYDNIKKEYKSGVLKYLVTDILNHDEFPEGIKKGFCILSIKEIDQFLINL